MIRLLFFLIGCNIYQLANYLVLVLCVVLVFANRAKIELKRSGLLFIVSVASITYWAIYMINYDSLPISTIFGRILVPILFVYIGLDRAKQGFESFILDVLYIGFGEFVHGILNVISNRNTPILTIAGRAYNDFWGGTISATIQNLLFIIPCSLLFYFLIIERRQFIKYMGLLAAFGGIVGTIASASRTLLYLTGLCFIVSLALYLWKYKHDKKSLKLCLWGGFVLIVSFAMFEFNAFGIRTILYGSALGQRIANATSSSTMNENLRLLYSMQVLQLMPQYWLGNIPTEHYAHNLWLDIAKETGVIPFLLYTVITLWVVFSVLRYCKADNSSLYERIVLIPLIFSFILVFFTEPILIGAPMKYSIFCYIGGGISYLNRRKAISILK